MEMTKYTEYVRMRLKMIQIMLSVLLNDSPDWVAAILIFKEKWHIIKLEISFLMEVNGMIAIQGLYDNGKIQFTEDAPMEKAKVIVIFPEEKEIKETNMAKKIAEDLFNEFTGSIKREIDEKSERWGALDEKYAKI